MQLILDVLKAWGDMDNKVSQTAALMTRRARRVPATAPQ
jgi:hypothetical protein